MDEILTTLAQAAVPVLAAFLSWMSIRLTRWLKEKAHSEMTQRTITKTNESILTLVREAEQTLVQAIKEAKDETSPGGRKMTKEEACLIKNKVIARFKRLWGPEGIGELIKVLGIEDKAFEKYIEAKVEETVHTEKQRTSINPGE